MKDGRLRQRVLSTVVALCTATCAATFALLAADPPSPLPGSPASSVSQEGSLPHRPVQPETTASPDDAQVIAAEPSALPEPDEAAPATEGMPSETEGAATADEPAEMAADEMPTHESDVVLVQVRDGATADEVRSALEACQGVDASSVSDEDVASGLVEISLSDGASVGAVSAQLATVGGAIEDAQPNYLYYPDGVAKTSVNDTSVTAQWALTHVRAFEAWSLAKCSHPKSGARVTVALLEGAFALGHPDLQANFVAPYNAHTGTAHADKPLSRMNNTQTLVAQSHGTMVAGVVGAVANNRRGIAGISYNARIMPVSIAVGAPVGSNATGTATNTKTLVAAFDYVIKHARQYNVRVINMSWSGVKDSLLERKINEAYRAGIVTVCSAGNSGGGRRAPFATYPSDYAKTVSVMNLSQSSTLNAESNYNRAGERNKTICAPGTNIITTIPGNGYARATGTSFSAPLVAGILALEFASDPSLTPAKAVELLYASAKDLGAAGFDPRYGYGEADAFEAVAATLPFHVISLNKNRGSGGATAVYERPGVGVYRSRSKQGVCVELMDGSANAIAVPKRAHYSFKGYYVYDSRADAWGDRLIDERGRLTAQFKSTYFSKSATLYAGWKPNIYAITLDQRGGTSARYRGHTIDKVYESYGDWVAFYAGAYYNMGPAVIPTKKNHTFEGYYTAANGGVCLIDEYGQLTSHFKPTRFTNDDHIYARWSPNVYTITLDANGGTGGSPAVFQQYGVGVFRANMTSGPRGKMTGSGNPISIPKMENHSFLGYFVYNESTGQLGKQLIDDRGRVTSNFTNTLYARNATLRAGWKRTHSTIKLCVGNGVVPSPWRKLRAGWYERRVSADSRVTIPNPTLAGNAFKGWRGAGVSSATTFLTIEARQDVTLTASWGNHCTIKLLTEGGTVTDRAWLRMSTQGYLHNMAITAHVMLPTPKRDGYVFEGWTAPDMKKPAESIYVLGTLDQVFTAKWTKGCTVTLRAGGSIADSNWTAAGSQVFSQMVKEKQIITLPTPTRPGWRFVGWKGGSLSRPTIQPRVSVRGNVTFTAEWKKQ